MQVFVSMRRRKRSGAVQAQRGGGGRRVRSRPTRQSPPCLQRGRHACGAPRRRVTISRRLFRDEPDAVICKSICKSRPPRLSQPPGHRRTGLQAWPRRGGGSPPGVRAVRRRGLPRRGGCDAVTAVVPRPRRRPPSARSSCSTGCVTWLTDGLFA